MKTKVLLALALLAIAVIAALAATPPQRIYALSWQDPSVPQLPQYSPGTNSVYKLYSTATLGTPLTNWPLVATWTNWTTGPGGWYTNYYTNTAQDTFFALTISNIFGEGPLFSAPNLHSGPVGQPYPSVTVLNVQ